MANHTCTKCGFGVSCSHGRWHDRHPVAAVLLALPAGYTIIGVLLAYPWFFVPLLVVVAAVWVDRRNRRGAAIAARADYEHRQLMAEGMFRPQRARLRTRGADHWSATVPLRAPGLVSKVGPGSVLHKTA